MTRFVLHYWPIPFRGQFVRDLLAHVGAAWEEPDRATVRELKDRPVADQPVPHMAPPVLEDREAGVWLSQMPAILLYLGDVHGLVPRDPKGRAMAAKIVCDANDVLDEVTLDGGKRMWTPEAWEDFASGRLRRWMAIFEETGRRHGLTEAGGTMLGTAEPGLADLVTMTLWHTMADRLPPIGALLQAEAPAVAALVQRLAATERIAAHRRDLKARLGDVYCGGRIGASLNTVVSGWRPERDAKGDDA